ncbi:MBL fold metallo-hydrolase [Rhizobium leguminosarum]|uniref:MBL fold metallo-hydrolase n=1 Tax=Rhizobium leguminosarum TaxID=384 RepID=UPI003918C1E4
MFIAGDTGFGKGWWAERARRKDRPHDLAILPVGAYEPRWFKENAHMMPEEAVASFEPCLIARCAEAAKNVSLDEVKAIGR